MGYRRSDNRQKAFFWNRDCRCNYLRQTKLRSCPLPLKLSLAKQFLPKKNPAMDEIKKSLDYYNKQFQKEIKNQQEKQKEQQARLAIYPHLRLQVQIPNQQNRQKPKNR